MLNFQENLGNIFIEGYKAMRDRTWEWFLSCLFATVLFLLPEYKEYFKLLIWLTGASLIFAVGKLFRDNSFRWMNYIRNWNRDRSRTRQLESQTDSELKIIKELIDQRKMTGVFLRDQDNYEEPLFMDGFLRKGPKEYQHGIGRGNYYYLTNDWNEWLRLNDGIIDRLIHKRYQSPKKEV